MIKIALKVRDFIRLSIWQPYLADLECPEVVERPEVREDCGLLGVRVVEAVEALSSSCADDDAVDGGEAAQLRVVHLQTELQQSNLN